MKKTTSASVIRYIDETTAQVTKSINKNPNQKTRRNMTFDNMEVYIATQGKAEDAKPKMWLSKQKMLISPLGAGASKVRL